MHPLCLFPWTELVQKIAQLGTVHILEDYKTMCMKNMHDPHEGPTPQLEVMDHVASKEEWISNYEIYSHYKFAIVLENSYRDGYITENILIAWLGGAVPIWYGTHDIFDIFNEKAFIYYDVEEPEAALEQIHYLDTNPDAYEAVLNEPILKNGQETIDEYFSFMDGKLRDRIRSTILGYEDGDDQMVEMVRK
uniref:Fucosyltransferase n=1 Tax=Ditylum brightwellii TaxID=49249 RepID=A0A7S1Z8D4_9STRA|mmetsp:Transcript_26578/g.39432  ORF Transcript_26578/g.39432 Transcript_26578/m.39432 type:complete len:192 (+) Transcript_26578:511-1086(+)